MSIVLNEVAWAEDAIQHRSLGKKPFETLTRVAKYYASMGLSKNEVRSKLDEFLTLCDPALSTVTWSGTLDRAARTAYRYPPVVLDSVHITKAELDKIGELPSRMAQKLAFTLLCIAKYYSAAGINTTYWVSTPDNEIMRMANIGTSIKRQCALFTQLRDAGLIQFSRKVDNTSVRVLFVADGDVAMYITDFRNLGYQYLMYLGEPYYMCENCGLVCRAKAGTTPGRRNKYCPDCSVKVRVKQNVESVMRGRKK